MLLTSRTTYLLKANDSVLLVFTVYFIQNIADEYY